jgi:hypothetical protein
MEGFQGEDRHNPLPHIALSTTALKSAYRRTASMATHLATELRELQALGGLEWRHPLTIPVAQMRFLVQPDCAKCVIAQRRRAGQWPCFRV